MKDVGIMRKMESRYDIFSDNNIGEEGGKGNLWVLLTTLGNGIGDSHLKVIPH